MLPLSNEFSWPLIPEELKEIDSLNFVISKRDILEQNTSEYVESLNLLLGNKDLVCKFRCKINYLIHGYDTDERELYEIPEVREFFKKLDEQWPYWFYFMTKDTGTLTVLALSLCKYWKKGPGRAEIDSADLQAFMLRHFDYMNIIFNRFGLSEELNVYMSDEIYKYFEYSKTRASASIDQNGCQQPADKAINWNFPHIYDYWDQKNISIDRLSRRLDKVPLDERKSHLQEIRDAITARANVLSNEDLAIAAFVMSDDLCKAARVLSYWDDSLASYLKESVGAFLAVLSQRGLMIHYVLDNTFEQTPAGMNGPLEWYATWYRTAGFKYICPQEIAQTIIMEDGNNRERYFELFPSYIDEARMVAEEVVKKCHVGNDNYFFLDVDSTPQSFEVPKMSINSPGVIYVFRNDPATPGSKCIVKMPDKTLHGKVLDHQLLNQKLKI